MIVLGEDQRIAEWVVSRIYGATDAIDASKGYRAIGFENAAGELRGGVVYYNYNGYDVEAIAAGEKGWLTPLNVKAIFLLPFAELGCRRMTTFISRKNKKSRKFVEKLGFKLEGVQRKAMADGRDAMIYGLLKTECKWIDHGKKESTATYQPAAGRQPAGRSEQAGSGGYATA